MTQAVVYCQREMWSISEICRLIEDEIDQLVGADCAIPGSDLLCMVMAARSGSFRQSLRPRENLATTNLSNLSIITMMYPASKHKTRPFDRAASIALKYTVVRQSGFHPQLGCEPSPANFQVLFTVFSSLCHLPLVGTCTVMDSCFSVSVLFLIPFASLCLLLHLVATGALHEPCGFVKAYRRRAPHLMRSRPK
jgi:hypothetical protein